MRTAKNDTVRSHGTLAPAVASTARPAAAQVVRSSVRREIGPRCAAASVGSPSVVVSTGSDQACRISGSLTAMCSRIAPIATQATAKCAERNEKAQGYHWEELASPVTSWKITDAISTATDSRSSRCSTASRDGFVGTAWNSRG